MFNLNQDKVNVLFINTRITVSKLERNVRDRANLSFFIAQGNYFSKILETNIVQYYAIMSYEH